jgi:hypothetical protein
MHHFTLAQEPRALALSPQLLAFDVWSYIFQMTTTMSQGFFNVGEQQPRILRDCGHILPLKMPQMLERRIQKACFCIASMQ